MSKHNCLMVPQDIAYALRCKCNGKYVYYQSQLVWCMSPAHATIFMGFDVAVNELAAFRIKYPDAIGTDYDVISLMGAFEKASA